CPTYTNFGATEGASRILPVPVAVGLLAGFDTPHVDTKLSLGRKLEAYSPDDTRFAVSPSENAGVRLAATRDDRTGELSAIARRDELHARALDELFQDDDLLLTARFFD
ncbi:MAG: hypothetical protein ABI614_18930, partial [Planctomycetota bacterium]